jgi:hypothetical protein
MKKLLIILALFSLQMNSQIKTINFKKDTLIVVKKGKKTDTIKQKVNAYMICLFKDTIINGKKGVTVRKIK